MVAKSNQEGKAKEEALGTPEARLQEVAGAQSTQRPRQEGPTQSAEDPRANTAPAALTMKTPAGDETFEQIKVRKLTRSTTLKIGADDEVRILRKLTDHIRKSKKMFPESTVKETPTRMLQDTFDDVSSAKKRWEEEHRDEVKMVEHRLKDAEREAQERRFENEARLAKMEKQMALLIEQTLKAEEGRLRAEEELRQSRLQSSKETAKPEPQPKPSPEPGAEKPKAPNQWQQLKEFEASKPNLQRAAALVKTVKEKGLTLKGRDGWEDLVAYLVGTLVPQEQWDPVHYDLEGPAWTPSTGETAIQIKGRKEMYIVLRDSLDWEKHGAKMRAISDSKDPTKSFNAQALFRHLNSFFAVGTKDGDIQGVGKELRSATMESTGKNVVDFALHLEKLVKRLTGLGLAPNEHLEVVPIYLNGLLGKFRDMRNTIENKIEDSPDKLFTRQEVVEMVERKANKRGLLNVTSKGTTVDQNVTVAKGTKGKKGKKGGNTNTNKGGDKNHENQVNQLKLQIKKLKEGAKPTKSTTQLQTSTGSTKDCPHGSKCWLTNCKFRHAAGHVPAANPRDTTCTTCGRTGHESMQSVWKVF